MKFSYLIVGRVDEPQFSDAGGIYQRWDESRPEGEKGFEGNAPRLNAARDPGLWHHVKILFAFFYKKIKLGHVK